MVTKRTDGELIRVQAPSYREALEKIQREFGSTVQVVRTRVIKKAGIAGMVGARAVEVLLAPSSRARVPGAPSPQASPVAERDRGLGAESGIANRPVPTEHGAQTDGRAAPMSLEANSASDEVVDRVSRTMQRLVEAREAYEGRCNQGGSALGGTTPAPLVSKNLSEDETFVSRDATVAKLRSDHSSGARQLARLVKECGFSDETASRLLRDSVSLGRRAGGVMNPGATLRQLIREHLPECRSIEVEPVSSRSRASSVQAIACVGPTGVGKTTTLAKLAAPLAMLHDRKVAIVALDTFRIGATDQVNRYGEIMGIPVFVADSVDELEREKDRWEEFDVVFIDTPGSNQRQVAVWEELRAKLCVFDRVEIHLCLPATGALDYSLECVERLRPVGYERLIFTKVDEAVRWGHLLDVWERARCPVSYYTCGQSVPDDIRAAAPASLEALILGESA